MEREREKDSVYFFSLSRIQKYRSYSFYLKVFSFNHMIHVDPKQRKRERKRKKHYLLCASGQNVTRHVTFVQNMNIYINRKHIENKRKISYLKIFEKSFNVLHFAYYILFFCIRKTREKKIQKQLENFMKFPALIPQIVGNHIRLSRSIIVMLLTSEFSNIV